MTRGPDRFARRPPRELPERVPLPLEDAPGLIVVDATWGVIQPMQLAPGVRTVGELEVIDHLRAGGAAVDCRLARYMTSGTLPGAVNIPHDQIAGRRAELDRDRPTVLFCNGPQCPATADAVGRLLAAGWPGERILYYRGGIHDWVTLGFLLSDPPPAPAAEAR